jgi:hypothetical protein
MNVLLTSSSSTDDKNGPLLNELYVGVHRRRALSSHGKPTWAKSGHGQTGAAMFGSGVLSVLIVNDS